MSTPKTITAILASALISATLVTTYFSTSAHAQNPPAGNGKGPYSVVSIANVGQIEQVLNQMDVKGLAFVGSATDIRASGNTLLIFKTK